MTLTNTEHLDTSDGNGSDASAPSPVAAPTPSSRLKGFAERNALLALLLAVITFFAVYPESSATFFTSQNASVLLGNQSVVALLALAVILPLVTGYFDFSLGAIAATSSVLTAGLMSFHDLPLGLAVAVGVGVGAVIGGINGLLVTRFGLNSFVTTLGMATLLGGLIQWYTGGQTILAGIDPALPRFGGSTWLGLPRVVFVVLITTVALWYLLAQTPFGRSLYAIGSNPRSARLVGIRVERSVWTTFVLAGALAGVTGVLQLARAGSATADNGTSLLFPALAAAFLGATAVVPGFFNAVGTIIGVLFVSVAVSGLTLSGASAWASPVFNGAALLVAVGLSHYLGRHRGVRTG
ncbi:ABC transporter permease [Blastococcus haudaquaticus]|uniref:Monosaccharide ABC transporter membrane protein, CUT2 family n=1 Tax=Blastococcus haudaquaticus TaxID=1938745 RepID=A0A286GQY1_9ACTN|nr:ABC transporter permease [Blastococcus haudaquaticus]SOD97943.1 monosaccharide ABC transporter membrane protein, CUT2 family [Blastococcus haudaquaticus]